MTNPSPIILTCVDGSHYTDSVCDHAAWASRRLDAAIHLLHVQASHAEHAAPADYSGAIGLGERSALREKLVQLDEARGKIDQQKGKLILEHAKAQLEASGTGAIAVLHRRGALVETLTELEPTAQLIVLGKRGEHADFARLHLGSNLERVVRAAHTPVLVCSRAFNPIHNVVIAFDGGASASKAVDFIARMPLLQGLACHLLTVGHDTEETRRMRDQAARTLTQRGFAVQAYIQPGHPEEVIAAYIAANAINLLVMGAYGHSRIRNLVIGSTTSAMLRSCHIPVLLFRA
jgi:nucleotide-binding universal stress UspA family protein